MPAGYSGTPLVKKLGIKPGFAVAVVGQPAHYWELLGELPQGVAKRQLVDVKVCAVDEVWSGLKLVRRVRDR